GYMVYIYSKSHNESIITRIYIFVKKKRKDLTGTVREYKRKRDIFKQKNLFLWIHFVHHRSL
ncbi:MAG: hypothetical protein Q7J55_04375, partial [bacterium]|nr:hypothetical protein [bacterium]